MQLPDAQKSMLCTTDVDMRTLMFVNHLSQWSGLKNKMWRTPKTSFMLFDKSHYDTAVGPRLGSWIESISLMLVRITNNYLSVFVFGQATFIVSRFEPMCNLECKSGYDRPTVAAEYLRELLQGSSTDVNESYRNCCPLRLHMNRGFSLEVTLCLPESRGYRKCTSCILPQSILRHP